MLRGRVLTYPLSYLTLEDEDGRKLFRRNWGVVAIVAALISVPFILVDANFFGDKGFLDRFGSFSAVLTGFYIAALVGVASFGSSVGDLDGEIEVGRIGRLSPNSLDGDDLYEYLTRRQYVCSMFGYLSFMSLVLSVGAILLVVVAEPVKLAAYAMAMRLRAQSVTCEFEAVRVIVIVVFNILLSHLLVTTCHGLYYLMDRLYATKSKILPKGQ